MRQTVRDLKGLTWLAEQWAAPLDQVAAVLECSVPSARNAVTRWRRARWVEAGAVDGGLTWVWPTQTMASALLGWQVKPYRPTVRLAAHTRAVNATRLRLCGAGLDGWRSERLILNGVGWRPGMPHQHAPDGVWDAPGGRLLVEVEISVKSPEALREVLVSLPEACQRHGAVGVLYVASPDARRALTRALSLLVEEFPGTGDATYRLLRIEDLEVDGHG